MKKNLLKSMLVALMVMVGGSAWADSFEILYGTPIYDTDGTTVISVSPQDDFTGDANELTGNTFADANGVNCANAMPIGGSVLNLKAAWSKNFATPVTSGKVYFVANYTVSANNSKNLKIVDSKGYAIYESSVQTTNGNANQDIATICGTAVNNFVRQARKAAYGVKSLCIDLNARTVSYELIASSGNNSFTNLTGVVNLPTEVTDVAGLQNTKTTYDAYLDHIAFYNQVSSEATYDYTINYTFNDGIVKTMSGKSTKGTVINAQNIIYDENGIKYFVIAEELPTLTISESGENTLNVPVRKAYTATLTVTTTIGDGEPTPVVTNLVENDDKDCSWSYAYPLYVKSGNTYYIADNTNAFGEGGTFTDGEAINKTVTYTNVDKTIVFFAEAESAAGKTFTYSNGNSGFVAAQNARNRGISVGTLKAGDYEFEVNITAANKRSLVLRHATDDPIAAVATSNDDMTTGIKTALFTLDAETADLFINGANSGEAKTNQSEDFDYVVIKKVIKPITPAYGKIWENGETTTDENQNTIAEVSAAYFNDFAKAKDTVRVAVEVTSPSVPSAPARNIAKGSISAFAGPDNIFAKTGIELGADTIDIILTEDALAKIKEAESLKFVYTNLTLKSIELIEAVADSAVLAEQAKLQDEITKAEGMLADENKTNGKDEFLTAINAAKALLTSIDIDAIKAGITALQTAEQTFIKANYFIDIAAGQYYIIDAETGKFMAAGHNYGTRGIVNTIGLDLTITPNTESRKVTIDTRIANEGNHFLGTNLYMDAVVAEWALEYRGFGFWITNGTQYISIDENDNLVMSDEPREWIIVTPEGVKEQRMEDMATATKDAPKDATWAIQCANFNRNDQRISAWKVSEDCTNKNLSGGSDDNRCAESWHSTFTISQTLTGMPKGVYALTAQGFYRQDGDNTEATPVFFANEETGAVSAKTGNEDNMNDASASFSAGNYTINPIYVEVGNDSTLKVGIKGTATSQWVIFDNFQLKYYGSEVSIDELKNAAIYAEMLALREQLKNIKPEVEIQVIKDSIDNVLNSTENPEGAEAINNTIVSLKAVLEVAQAYVRVKTILPNMNQLTESTNFYTEEALNQYYTQWVAKYQNGTLTKDEADALKDPFLIAGWRSANTIDDLLMSVWDENPENWESYHVNNWSTEGGTDGTNFVVPFIEYWTGDANNLAPKTLTATINNLEQGNYQVSVRVRVRVKDGANDPTGITMTVNDELPTNVCAGTQVGETQFYMDEFTAVGDVYSDGVLKFKFNVLDGNNISWLAFKDVVYTRLSDVVGIAGVKSENKFDGTVYNLNGQKVEKAQRGLYIMNGKKVVVK